MKEKRGITLIALIVTIIILLILAEITITAISQGGLFGRAKEAAFKTRMTEYKEKTNMYVSWKVTETLNPDTSEINAGEMLKKAIDDKIITDIEEEEITTNIEEVIENIKNSDKNLVVVYKGEMYYVSNKSNANNENQVKWCKDIGIKILEYTEPTGIVVKNGKYELVKGVYLCTPKLDKGFEKEKTRYLEVNSQENLTPGNWITDNPSENWYDYKNSKWANIIVENNGQEIYYTWIPRYEFVLDQTNQRSTVKFLSGTEGAESGYQVPEAFTFNGQELTGYWAMKYTAGTEAAPRFDTEVMSTSSSIKTKGITGTAKGDGQVYKYYINGEYKGEKTKAEETFEYTGLNSNTKYTIQIEIRNSTTDEYLGSIVKQIKTIEANKPELTGFNANNTYYVLYDENGNETIGEKIKNDGSNMPKNWYDYSQSKWANIVVQENGKTTYFTWIPRYEFMITSSQYSQPTIGRTEVRFIQGISTETDLGYQIPEAFTFNGQQLKGYWAMKYTAGE